MPIQRAPNPNYWASIASSADGSKLAAIASYSSGGIFVAVAEPEGYLDLSDIFQAL